MSSARRVLTAAVLAAGCFYARAGGPATGGASEWTQIANHIELAKQSADTAQTAVMSVQQYLTMMEQLRYQIRNSTGMDPIVINSELSKINFKINQMKDYQAKVAVLTGGLQRQQQMMDTRVTEARVGGMSWDQYRGRVVSDLQDENSVQRARVARETELLQQNSQLAEQVVSLGYGVQGDDNLNRSVQTLALQLSGLAQQNATMIEMMNEVARTSRQEKLQKMQTQTQQNSEADLIWRRQKAIRARQREFIGIDNGATSN